MPFSRRVIVVLTLAPLWPAVAQPASQARPLHIESDDGFVLAARYYSAGAAGPGVMLLHQCDREGPRTGYEELTTLLTARGFNVLELDLRGFGKSRDERYPAFRGHLREIAPKFPGDVEAAYQHLVAQEEVDGGTIGVVGASCGASQAIFLAQHHETITALVFLSGALWPGARDAFDDVKHLPILIATSEGDQVTETLREVFAASEAPSSRFLLYKGDLHGTPLFGLDNHLRLTILEWLVDALTGAVDEGTHHLP